MLDEAAILTKLTSFDRQNSDNLDEVQPTDQALDFVAGLLEEAGLRVEFQDYEIGEKGKKTIPRRNLLARLSEDREGLPFVGLEGHIDTVPFGDYKGNPLGEVRDGRIYGRGTVDMSSGLSCMVYALMQLQGMDQRSSNPVLIVTSDEEAHSFAGIHRYLRDDPKLDFAICGEASELVVKDRLKGALYYIVTMKGKSGHGSRQHEGENAIVKAVPVLQALKELYGKVPMIMNEDFRTDDLHSHRSSMNIGLIRAGSKVNTIPDEMRIEFEMRVVRPAREYLDLIGDTLAPHRVLIGEEKLVFAVDPIIAKIEPSNPFYEKAKKLSEKRGVVDGFTEANHMNRKGIPTVVFGPGDNAMAHSAQEFVEMADLKTYTGKLLELIR